MSVLVTGGAGYIGSHVVHLLLDQGENVIVVDDLSTGVRAAVPDAAAFHEGNAGDNALIEKLLAAHDVDTVVHLAGSSVVHESIERPLDYYRNNCIVSLKLIETAVKNGVGQFIFASSASVYGAPCLDEVTEETEPSPINPYGRSKLIAEEMLQSAALDSGLRYVALRYFNVAGADPGGRAGKLCATTTHLMDRAVKVALDRLPFLEIFGIDYATPDGTCVRDYIHIADLVDIHANALAYLRQGGSSAVLNCGLGKGASVLDVISRTERVADRAICVKNAARRPGDPPILVADTARIRSVLNWTPRFEDLDEIVRSAYAWEKQL